MRNLLRRGIPRSMGNSPEIWDSEVLGLRILSLRIGHNGCFLHGGLLIVHLSRNFHEQLRQSHAKDKHGTEKCPPFEVRICSGLISGTGSAAG